MDWVFGWGVGGAGGFFGDVVFEFDIPFESEVFGNLRRKR